MARISDEILDCVFYLYPSEQDARDGEQAGGTGFLVSVPLEVPDGLFVVYAVTNSHVVREAAATTLRMNTRDGGVEIRQSDPDAWIHHPEGDDVAVCRDLPIAGEVRFRTVAERKLLSKDMAEEHDVGPGDEVFVVGRFVDREGKQRNLPTARFGHLAMMPWEPFYNEHRHLSQEGFQVELLSLSGFSGSPVFLYIPPMSRRPGRDELSGAWHLFLLGIDTCHIARKRPVVEWSDDEKRWQEMIPKAYVEMNSGMMGVVPAWKISEILHSEELVAQRRELGQRWVDEHLEKSDTAMEPPGGDSKE